VVPNTPVDPPPVVDTTAVRAPTLERTVVATGLSNPWDLAVLADGTLFFTERCRGLSVRRPDGSTTRLFGTSGSALLADDLVCQGQSGMMGVALDPAFASNRFVYVMMASNRRINPRTNRVVRVTLNENFTAASARLDLVEDIAYKDVSTPNGGPGAHSGGRLRVGPDGWLYIATGDNHDGPLPQHPTRLAEGAAVPPVGPAGRVAAAGAWTARAGSG
jgi:glucose/arabinose dehydrogenase